MKAYGCRLREHRRKVLKKHWAAWHWNPPPEAKGWKARARREPVEVDHA